MQFNPGDGTGILDDIDFICGTDSTGFPTADKTRSVNRWNYKVIHKIRMASESWKWDDSNHTTMAFADADLVAGQAQYTLDPTMTDIDAVEVVDSDGNYRRIKLIARSDIKGSITDYLTEDGLPAEGYLSGNILTLEPAPAAANVTTTNGLRIFCSREADAFSTSDTIQQPGFAEPYHRILSLGPSYDYFTIHAEMDKANLLRGEIELMMSDLEEFYGIRNPEVKNQIIPRHRTANYE